MPDDDTNPLVDDILKASGGDNPPPLRMFIGYLGRVNGRRRMLYLDKELCAAVDLPADNYLHKRFEPPDEPFPLDAVWVNPNEIAFWNSEIPAEAGRPPAPPGGGPGGQYTYRPPGG
jgi:hypothetical protein